MKLTHNERIVFKAAIDNALHSMGGTNAMQLIADNFSWFNIKDLTRRTTFNRHECAGYISSLREKGLIEDNEGDGTGWMIPETSIYIAVDLGLLK